MDRHAVPDQIAAPKECPFCRSMKIGTTSKNVNDSTYWRCEACGQIWNAGRLMRSPPPRRWFR